MVTAPGPPSSSSEKRPFLRVAGLVSVITMFSRLLGLVRDAVMAACLGASRWSDIFLFAFELPNLARRVLGEGSLSAFIVPVFTKVRSELGEKAAWRFASNALTVLAVMTLVMTAFGVVLARWLFLMYGAGYYINGDLEAVRIGTQLTRIMFPFLMLLTLSSILMGLCHAVRHFSTPALGSIMLNITMILTGLLFIQQPEWRIAQLLAVSVLVGGGLRLVIMIPPLARAGFRYRPVIDLRSPHLRRLFLMLLPAVFGLAVVQINISISRMFAGLLGEGLATSLIYSNRLVQLPLAIIASAMATAILPQLSLFWVEKRHDDLRDLVRLAFRLLFILFVPASMGLIVLGHPIISLLFARGNWGAEATEWTYMALLMYAPALVIWGMMRIITPIYYAAHDVRTPVITATIALLVNIALNLALVFIEPLRSNLSHAGLALANTIGVSVNAMLLLWILRRRGIVFWEPALTWTLVKTCAAAAIMGVFCHITWRFGGLRAMEWHKMAGVVALGIIIACGGTIYFITALFLRVPDMQEATRVILRKKR